MCRFIETIRIMDGRAENIFWHNKRFNRTREDHYGIKVPTDLMHLIKVPDKFSAGEVKCRIGYGETIDFIEFEPYSFRPVNSLKLVFDNSVVYGYKYRERSQIMKLFDQKGDEDDIIIIKNGMVTDSSYCNLVFSDGNDLCTPDSPMLKGTKREKLIYEGRIIEKLITAEDIFFYREVHLINAFLDPGRCVVPISKIS